MYTRCPKCETCFRVTDRHLAIAKGKVRCGRCQLVFNAIENAIDDLPTKSTTSPEAAPTQTTRTTAAPTPPPKQPKPEAPGFTDKATTPKSEVKEVEKKANITPDSTTINKASQTALKKEVAKTLKTETQKKEMPEAKVEPVPSPKIAPPLYKTEVSKAVPEAKAEIKNEVPVKKTPPETKAPETIPSEEKTKLAPVHHDAFHAEDGSFDENFDFDAAIDELTHAAEEITYDYDQTSIIEAPAESIKDDVKKQQPPAGKIKNINIFSTDEDDTSSAASVEDILNEMKGQLSLNIDTPSAEEKKNYNADDEFDFIDLNDEPDEKNEPESERKSESKQVTNQVDTDLDEFDFDDDLGDEFDEPAGRASIDIVDTEQDQEASAEDFLQQFDALGANKNSQEEEIIISDPAENEDPKIKIGEHSDDYEVPYQLRDDIDRLNAGNGRTLHPAIKAFLIIILVALSFSQLAYFRAHELVGILPDSRNVLASFCETIGCQYSGPSDTQQIELVSRDVRQHPKENDALLISAVMVNNAYFAQPYPNIHIRLSDISGNVVAERVFNPKTYMGKLSNPFLLMRSKTPVHINFEVVDPGKDAVNFEFTFM